jgi:hypothetical protein
LAPGFGNVIAGNRHRVEVADLVMNEEFLDIAHHLERKLGREDAGILPLIFLENVGLHRAAHIGQHPGANLLRSRLRSAPTVVATNFSIC